MRYLPIFLDIQGRKAVVLGTGAVAERKAEVLRRAGAVVEIADRFAPALLNGCALAIGADAPPAELQALSALAKARGIPVNIVDRPALCSYITPAIIDRDPLIVAIGSGGAAPVLARMVRQRIEAMLPRSLSRLAALAGSLSTEVRARFPDLSARRRVLERILGGRAADLVGAGDEPAALAEMRREIERGISNPPGIVYIVGAGLGESDLLTLRAHRLLGEADVIVYDPAVSADVLDLARRDADRLAAEENVAAQLVRLVRAGKRVVRLVRGDPGAFPDEAGALAAAGAAYQVVPGVAAPVVSGG